MLGMRACLRASVAYMLACTRGVHACVHPWHAVHTRVHAHTHRYTHTHTHTHTGASTESTHTHTNTNTHECNGDEYMKSCADTHARVHTYIHTCIHTTHQHTYKPGERQTKSPHPHTQPPTHKHTSTQIRTHTNTHSHKTHKHTHTRGGRGTGKRALYGRLSGGETAAQRAQGQGALQALFTLCHAQRPVALGNPGSPSSMHARK